MWDEEERKSRIVGWGLMNERISIVEKTGIK